MKNQNAELAAYSEKIMESQPSARVQFLIGCVRDNMTVRNTPFQDMGTVLNDQTKNLRVIVRKAMAEKQKLERVPVGIWDQQLFAGCFTLREERIVNTYALPEFASKEEQLEGEKYGFGIYSMFGHISPNYPRLLTLGTSGIIKMAKSKMDETQGEKNKAFLQAVIISLEGLEIYANRNAEMLFEKAKNETDLKRKEKLHNTAEALTRCPKYPAETYLEACQTTWLLHLALQLTDNYLALGRVDQYLYPYLKNDLEKERLTLDQAQEITDCFMLKFNERSQDNETAAQMMDLEKMQQSNEKKWRERTLYDIGHQRYNVRDTLDAINHWNQNVMIGGVDPENGEDAANFVTVMLLESFRRVRMTNPVLSIRIHKNTPQFLLNQTAVTLKTGGGLPALYNDEVIIKSYEKFGIDVKDARDYANNGCWEVLLPGRTDFYFIKFNTLKCLEWALNHGKCHLDDKEEVPDQGDAGNITTFEELYGWVMNNFRIVMEGAARHMVETQHHRSIVAPVPLLSALLEGPIEKGLDMTEMGARFIIGGTIAEGISHLIDSLCAVNQVVFCKKEATMKEVIDAIDHNFEGYMGLRTKLRACPKYGANEPLADAIGSRVTKDYAEIMLEIDQKYSEMKFMPGIGTFSWYIAVGEGTGASPDGRLSGEQVASNFSPSAGAMTRGITGAMQSFSKMNLDVMPLGSPLDLGLSSRYVTGDEGTARLMGLIKSFAQMDGNLLTISVADVETLREAQHHPEQYRDLRVRMGGWSAYFTMLSPEQQEHHIRKTEAGFF